MPSPFVWTLEIEGRLFDEIAGGRAINTIAREEWCPSEATIYRRMATDAEFNKQISAARTAQQESEMDKCIQMADDATTENWQVVRLRIWARQWRAGKLAPKKYGEKIDVTSNGKSLELTPEQRAAKIAALAAAARRRKTGNASTDSDSDDAAFK